MYYCPETGNYIIKNMIYSEHCIAKLYFCIFLNKNHADKATVKNDTDHLLIN